MTKCLTFGFISGEMATIIAEGFFPVDQRLRVFFVGTFFCLMLLLFTSSIRLALEKDGK